MDYTDLMMKTKFALVSALATVAVALSACGGPTGYTESDHKEFMTGCTSSGTPDAVCDCMWDAVTAKFTRDELEKLKDEPDAQAKLMEKIGPDAIKCLTAESK